MHGLCGNKVHKTTTSYDLFYNTVRILVYVLPNGTTEDELEKIWD